MSDIVGIGSSVYDTLMTVDNFPPEDTKMMATSTKIMAGGPVATGIVASAKLGVSAEYMGCLGDDVFGNYMFDDFGKWNVGTDNVVRKHGVISFHSVVILNTTKSTRTCVWNKGTIPEITPEELNYDAIKQAKILHLDGHQLTAAIAAAKFANENGVKVSLDAGGMYPHIEDLLPYVDYLIPSEEFALGMTGASDADQAAKILYDKYSPEFVVITQGKKGGIIYDGELRRYPIYDGPSIDSNGAGDVFHGAFIAAKIKGYENYSCCCFASAVSGLKCAKVGAREGTPTYNETIDFLNSIGVTLK